MNQRFMNPSMALTQGTDDYDSDRKELINNQKKAYSSGAALKGHIASAHKGVEDPACQACKELRKKSGL